MRNEINRLGKCFKGAEASFLRNRSRIRVRGRKMSESEVCYSDPLVLTIINQCGGKYLSHLRLQKLAFLCEVESPIKEVSDFCHYGSYKYGPYSEETFNEMVNLKLFKYARLEKENRDEKVGTRCYVTEMGKTEAAKIAEQRKEAVAIIETILNRYKFSKTSDLLDHVYKNYTNVAKDPSALKQKSEAALGLAENYEKEAIKNSKEEDVMLSTILTMAGEIYSKLHEKANSNLAESYLDTKKMHFQNWSRYLNITDRNYAVLSAQKFQPPLKYLCSIQDSLIKVMVEAEEYGFAPTDEELQSRLPEETLIKLQNTLAC